MRYKFLIILIAAIFPSVTLAQTNSYFIKYKNSISKIELETRLNRKSILSEDNNSFFKISDFQIDRLANGLASGIDELFRIIKITFTSDEQAQIFLTSANNDPLVEYIQKENVYKIDFIPNDSLISEQWALSRIQAFDAWNITQGSDTVLIGIIDTGIDFNHIDLSSQFFINIGEMGIDAFGRDRRNNSLDDDDNGFIDDYRGWDFTDRVGFPFDSTGGDYLDWDNNPIDENNHGTYIAGIAGAAMNNQFGVAGISPKSKLINIRAFDPNGYGEEDDVAAAILYAVQMGAKVINMSFGDNAFSYVLRDVIKYAYSQGVVLVASAGNSGSSDPHYPSGYSEVICVGNSTSEDYVSSNSNFGSTIDLVAPGSSIITTAKDNNYAIVSGTSASAPFVSASAALILSLENFTNEEIKQILKSTSDDIEKSGWDLKSGAGRLNLFKALSTFAPSKILINYPTQDVAISSDHLEINATVLSAYFVKYELYYGMGLNPTNWMQLIDNGLSQFNNQNIYSLNTSTFADTAYALRLVVYLNNGRTLEERVNFFIDRTPPTGDLISVTPAFYGNKSTILAAVQSNEPGIVRMFYKKQGTADFKFITLDGFASNSQFVKRLHYGFIPKHLVEQNSIYSVYFELENLVGLKNIIRVSNDSLFNISTTFNASLSPEIELPYSLNKGSIFSKPTNFLSQKFNEVLFSEFYPTDDLFYALYKVEGSNFIKVDSIKNKLPRDVGDFNFNGKTDLLSSIQRNGFIDEQDQVGSFNLINKFSNSSEEFWPIMAKDIDLDGITEILAVDSDTSITVWRVDNDLSLKDPIKLKNFSVKSFGGNIIDAPNSVIADMDGDGKNEIWMVDLDGDVFSFEHQNGSIYVQNIVFSTQFLGSSALLTTGDYNGDGKQELAVLLHSIDDLDIAPFYRLLVFNFNEGNLNVLYDQAFIDASVEFNASFRPAESSIRFEDLDLDGKQEMIAFVFPFSYIFKYSPSNNLIMSYKENVNSNSIFVGDLNMNGIAEVAFPTNDGIKFYEFALSNKAIAPNDFYGYSTDSTKVYLKWSGLGSKFYIFRGDTEASLVLKDSVFVNSYTDNSVFNNVDYFYAIQAYDESKPEPISNLSQILKIHSHLPAKIDSVFSKTAQSIIVRFSNRIGNTIDNLGSFNILNCGTPNSISPLDQKSLLLTYNQNLRAGKNYLMMNNIRDYFGSPMQTDTVAFIVDSFKIAQEQFYISSHELLNPYKLRIKFNLEVDGITASNPANYLFSPINNITSALVDPADKTTVYLTWTQKPVGSIGTEYTLHVVNLLSSITTGNLRLAAGSGSYIVLTGFVEDLSDVYVYPQPVSINNGIGKIMFANIPNKAQILILNLQGEKIASLEEIDGNGGAEYSLKDQNGNSLSSGIYLYRIVRLDSSGNEVEEKLGKFAVIK